MTRERVGYVRGGVGYVSAGRDWSLCRSCPGGGGRVSPGLGTLPCDLSHDACDVTTPKQKDNDGHL